MYHLKQHLSVDFVLKRGVQCHQTLHLKDECKVVDLTPVSLHCFIGRKLTPTMVESPPLFVWCVGKLSELRLLSVMSELVEAIKTFHKVIFSYCRKPRVSSAIFVMGKSGLVQWQPIFIHFSIMWQLLDYIKQLD